jgi:ABC-type antimicrobial peptide transport system permease subunit
MIRNYFKIAWRNLAKSKGYSAINIGGLAIGMAVAMLIGLWIYDELSFNKYHKNYDKIARVMQHQTFRGERSTRENNPIPLGIELRSSFKDDFKYVVMSSQAAGHIISAGEKKLMQTGNYMQPEAAEMLTLKMLYGSRAGLADMNSILLSQSLAEKLFGNDDPMDKLLTIDNKLDVKIKGVYENLPVNSEFKDLAFIAPWDLFISSAKWLKDAQTDWGNNFLHIYVQIAPNSNPDRISAKIKDLKLSHVDKEYAARQPSLFLQPMSKWHLYSKYENGVTVMSEQMKLVWLCGIIGVFVLLLACINFMNLSTARSVRRAKEVGVRKAIGSLRGQLINQFFSESILTAALAFVLSIILVQLILPWFNEVADKKISILWANPLFWVVSGVVTFITGLFAGSYPALYLSSFNPVKVLKGTFRTGRLASVPRNVLVVFQFTISITLIIGTIVVYRQIQFAKDRPVGYSREGLLVFQKTSRDFKGKSDVLRAELINTSVVAEVAESSSPVTDIDAMNGGFNWKDKDPAQQADFGTLGVNYEYGKTIGWQFVGGRDFSRDFPTDSNGFIINEATAKLMGLKNPVGEMVQWNTDDFKGGSFKILGVVRDMVMKSPFEPIKPTIFFLQGYKHFIFIKVNPTINIHDALTKIEAVFKSVVPSAPFDYQYVDEEYAAKFAAEERIGKLSGFFSILAILISCFGLFGLASFVAAQRTREIGIRKVFGASVFSVWQLLSRHFVVLVIVSCFIAIPAAYYFMNNWLQKYEYRTGISWWIFAVTIGGAIIITLLTVSFQAIRAAVANPVKSLRTE